MSGRGKAAAGAKAKAASGSTGKKGKGTSRSSKAGKHNNKSILRSLQREKSLFLFLNCCFLNRFTIPSRSCSPSFATGPICGSCRCRCASLSGCRHGILGGRNLGARRQRVARQQEASYRAASHPVGCAQRWGTEQVARRRHDRVGWCHSKHPLCALAKEEQGQGWCRHRLWFCSSVNEQSKQISLCVFETHTKLYFLKKAFTKNKTKKKHGCFYSHHIWKKEEVIFDCEKTNGYI